MARVRKMTADEGVKVGLSAYPNFHKSGRVVGMKRKYYGRDALLVCCGNYIYNVSASPEIYNKATPLRK